MQSCQIMSIPAHYFGHKKFRVTHSCWFVETTRQGSPVSLNLLFRDTYNAMVCLHCQSDGPFITHKPTDLYLLDPINWRIHCRRLRTRILRPITIILPNCSGSIKSKTAEWAIRDIYERQLLIQCRTG